MRRSYLGQVLLVFAMLCAVVFARLFAAEPAAKPADAAAAVDAKAIAASVDRAVQFLTAAQAADGSFSTAAGPGPTAIITTALLRHGRGLNDPVVAKAMKYLEGMVHADGGIYQPGAVYANYETCLCLVCFKEANRDGRYDKTLKAAEAYVKEKQWDEGEKIDKSDLKYGGAGYGKKERPDLSNTQFLVDALVAAGEGPKDEAMQKALVFVSRCQNFYSENNNTPFATQGPKDGGFFYTCAAGGDSPAGKTAEGGLKSYGSMTYAGLKSMIHCGLTPDDPRVKAAADWVKKNYDVKANPEMGNAGLYYYYHTFAKALDAMKLDAVEDAKGVKHNWRAELAAELVQRQRPDGSWINSGDNRWMEGDPNLVTGYALLSLAYCRTK